MIIAVAVVIAAVTSIVAYQLTPKETSGEDVKRYLSHASEGEIEEFLAPISDEILLNILREKHSITDDLGREVTLINPPKKIVSMAPSITEILFALNLGDRVIGVTKYCDYPPEVLTMVESGKLELIGGFSTVSVEKIISLVPDFTIGVTGVQKDFVLELSNRGSKVVAFEGDNIFDVISDISAIGKICWVEEEAEKLAENMKIKVEEITAKTENVPVGRRPNVLWITGHEPLMSAGPETFIDDIIGLAGGKNIFSDAASDWPVVSEETILERDPEFIFFPNHIPQFTVKDVEEMFPEVSAVRENNVYKTPADIFSRAGPRLIEALEFVAERLHPDLLLS